MTRSRDLLRLILPLVALSTSCQNRPFSCSRLLSPRPENHTYINVGFQNSTAVALTIGTTGPGFDGTQSGTYNPGYTPDEFVGTSGDRLTFSVTGSGGLAGSGSCIAKNAIVGTSEYGQVNLSSQGTVVTVQCSSGWQ